MIQLVGTTGFEPATPCPPDKCATKLRYIPTRAVYLPFVEKALPETCSFARTLILPCLVRILAFPKKSIIGTVSYMPAMFGCTMASVVIRDLMEA